MAREGQATSRGLAPEGPTASAAVRRLRAAQQAASVEAPAQPPAPQESAAPDRGYRLRTATSDAEIERQIQRLMNLIANDNVDPNAPPGSYLNMLV